jgi:hypothetical protein
LSSNPDPKRLLLSVLPPRTLEREGKAQGAAPQPNPKVTLEATVGTLNGEELQLGQKVSGEEVYIVGPETNLTFTDAERKVIQANFIAENIVAVFLYSGRITTLAEILAERGWKGEGDSTPEPTAKRRVPRPPVIRELFSRDRTRLEGFLNPAPAVDRLLGTEVDPQAIVETFVRFAYRDSVPSGASSPLTFSAELSGKEGQTTLTIAASHRFSRDIEEDPVFSRALYLLLTRPPYRPNAQVNRFMITVPITERGGDPEFAWNQATYTPQPGTAPRKVLAPQEGLTGVVKSTSASVTKSQG